MLDFLKKQTCGILSELDVVDTVRPTTHSSCPIWRKPLSYRAGEEPQESLALLPPPPIKVCKWKNFKAVLTDFGPIE